MEFVQQSLEDILDNLSALQVEWKDDLAQRVIERIERFPIKAEYTAEDIHSLFAEDFEQGKLICRLFLGLSKDMFTAVLNDGLGEGGQGVMRYRRDPEAYANVLIDLHLLEVITEQVNRKPKWSDVLVERLRSGRG